MVGRHIWLRAEASATRPSRGDSANLETDRRTPLVPADARLLIEAGFQVTVEKSEQRVFLDSEYEAAGCALVEAGGWREAPKDALVLGIRAPQGLSVDCTGLERTHMYFGHAYKGQKGAAHRLAPFVRGGGLLLDLEFVNDPETGARLTSFGPSAGIIATAAAVLAWCKQVLVRVGMAVPEDLLHRVEGVTLVAHIKALLQLATTFAKTAPRAVIIGPRGRVGSKAVEMARELGIEVALWGREQTAGEGPFPALLEFDILINAISLGTERVGPFVTHEAIRRPGRRLAVVVDVACDVSNPNNPLPIYDRTTTFEKPALRVLDGDAAKDVPPLDVIAIPTLPALVPSLSSADFSGQLRPLLMRLDALDSDPVWSRTRAAFDLHTAWLRPAAVADAAEDSQLPAVVSFAQEREAMRPARLPVTLVLQAPADVTPAQLQTALAGVVARHAALRTSFRYVDKDGHRRLTAAITPAKLVDAASLLHVLTASGEADERTRALEVVRQQQASPFDFDKAEGPLLRVVLSSGAGAAVLVIAADRLVADEHSLHLIGHELLQAATGETTPYTSYAQWQRRLHEVADADEEEDEGPQTPEAQHWREQVTYWRERMKPRAPTLQLPNDRPRPAVPDWRCGAERLTLEPALWARVVELARRIAAPTAANSVRADPVLAGSMAIVTAAWVVLSRWAGEEDVAAACFVSRPLPRTVGPLARPLPLRCHVHAKLSFPSLFANLVDALSQAARHQDAAAEALAADAGEDVSPISFVLPGALAPLPSADFSPVSPYDLSFHLSSSATPGGAAVEGTVLYNQGLYVPERAREIIRQIRSVLAQVAALAADEAALAKTGLGEFALVTDEARPVLPAPSADLDTTWEGPVHTFLTKHARERPDLPAISYHDQVVTYQQLEERSSRLAHYLLQQNLGREQPVVIYGHRSPAVVVAILAVLKAGAAYSMVDPKYPASRIIDCVTVAKARGWLQIAEAGTPPDEVLQFLGSLGLACQATVPNGAAEFEKLYGGFSAVPPEIDVGPDDVAVVTFTSGSTGLPKGVMGRHLPLTHFYPWMATRFGIGAGDRFSMCSGIAHDPLQRDIFTPIFFGAQIYIPPEEDIGTPGALAKWFARQQINVACLTPAMGQLLITVDDDAFKIDSLRAVFFVGDLLIKRDVARLRRMAPHAQIINMYGSTETQRSVGYWVVPSDEEVRPMKEVMPCGEGMKDVQLLIINEAGQLAGVGEVAEIYVRSPHLARGYLGLDAETRAKFLPNPLGRGLAWDRAYRTGDLGRYNTRGEVECSGRADDQVKIRGFRIELGEVNAALAQHPQVKENVTVLRTDRAGEKHLVSYIVPASRPADPVPATTHALQLEKDCRDFLRSRLPQYMVPRRVVVLRALPLTPNGKINRPGLPDPFAQDDASSEAAAAAAAAAQAAASPDSDVVRVLSDTERGLLEIFAQLLGASPLTIQLDDDFFELGGHSLLATQAIFHISQKLHVHLPINLLFQSPTIAALATHVDRIKRLGSSRVEAESAEDLMAHARALDAAVRFVAPAAGADAPALPATPSTVFITGATGFVGAFLVREVMQRTSGRVLCLVRADSPKHALARLETSLKAHAVWRDDWLERLVAVPGDLARPRLGLDEAPFLELARSVDAILHNGAFLHWLHPYKALAPANVLGTQEVLRLACSSGRAQPTPVHVMSTTSVYEATEVHKLARVGELELEHWRGIGGGYPQSKWVADKMAQIARAERGIPTSVYRPAYIVGDTTHGLWNTDDFLCRLIKGCIQLGAAPELEGDIAADMTPVDYVAHAVVALMFKPPALGHTFNITNPAGPVPFRRLFEAIGAFGYPVQVVPYAEWRRLLVEATNAGEENALSALLAHFGEDWAASQRGPVYERPNADAFLADVTDAPTAAISDELLWRYFTYFIHCGFLPAPPKQPTNALAIDWQRISDGVQSLVLLTRTNRS